MGVAWWALAVSGLSLIVAIGSLAWNVHSFRRSGPLLLVELRVATGWTTKSHPSEVGTRRTLFFVDVYNRGRSPVDIVRVNLVRTVRGGDPPVYVLKVEPEGLPARIEHGSKMEFAVGADEPALPTARYVASVLLGNKSDALSAPATPRYPSEDSD